MKTLKSLILNYDDITNPNQGYSSANSDYTPLALACKLKNHQAIELILNDSNKSDRRRKRLDGTILQRVSSGN